MNAKRNSPVKANKVKAPGLTTRSARIPKKMRAEVGLPAPLISASAEVKSEEVELVVAPTPSESAHGDSLLLYMREVGLVKLLTPAEEMALAKRIQKGD